LLLKLQVLLGESLNFTLSSGIGRLCEAELLLSGNGSLSLKRIRQHE
jgi:hypothetical protein